MVTRYPVLALAFVALAQVACSKSHGDEPCPPNQPAFHLELTAADGVLPPDTELSIGYEGILKEHYSLAKGGPENSDLCCAYGDIVKGALPNIRCRSNERREASVPVPSGADAAVLALLPDSSAPRDGAPVDAAAGAADAAARLSGPLAIHCSIWTDNVADLKVTASDYAKYTKAFEAYVPDPRCGVETIDVRVTLYHPEGGL